MKKGRTEGLFWAKILCVARRWIGRGLKRNTVDRRRCWNRWL